MSVTIRTTLTFACERCPDDAQRQTATYYDQSAKAARINLRKLGWTREKPDGKGAMIDVCPACSRLREMAAYRAKVAHRRVSALKGVATRNARKGVPA